jgi:hypothetical protein
VEANAPFGWPYGIIVLGPVASEDFCRPIIHFDREVNDENPLWFLQHCFNTRVKPQFLCGNTYLLLGNFEWV